MMGFIILTVTIFIGFYAPKPPGLFGMLIEYYWFGGKERQQKEIAKWRKLNNIDSRYMSPYIYKMIKEHS